MKSPQAIIHLSSSSLISFLFYGLAITCLTPATVTASYGGNETDYLALLSFKSKITHDPYKVLNSWNHSVHFCDWGGILCGKRHKRVTVLWLDSQGLEGSLSPHVGNLSFLRHLSLSNNSFQGTIPHELGRLFRLRRLYLSINKFSGVIPTNLSGCSNLEDLRLASNKLAGSIPKEMSLLSKLAHLSIHYNKLTGGIPSFLGNITSMEVFSATANPLGGRIPDTLGHWKSLMGLYSGGCNLYGSIPHSIFNLSLLVNFSIAENYLTGSLPSEIGNQLPNLEWLQLRDNELTGILPPSLSNCSKLRILEMNDNNFSGKLTIDFSNLRDTYEIWLGNNNFHGRREADDMRFVDSLKNCTKLVRLELSNCNLIGVLPISIGTITSSLGECISLTYLSLSGNIFEGIIPSSFSSLRGLEVLEVSQNNISGVFANTNAFSVLGNDRLCGGLVTLKLPKCKETGSMKKRVLFFILVIGIAVTLLFVLCCVYLLCKKKHNSQPSESSGSERFMKVSYSQLLKATDGFSAANLIGEGAFSCVYKGNLDSSDGKFVAIKVLRLENPGAHKSFLAECEAWRNIR